MADKPYRMAGQYEISPGELQGALSHPAPGAGATGPGAGGPGGPGGPLFTLASVTLLAPQTVSFTQ